MIFLESFKLWYLYQQLLGTSPLKVILRNYKKVLHTRSDLICFDDIFDQIESSISNNIIRNFFRQPLHNLSRVTFIISTFEHLAQCTLANTNVVRALILIFWQFLFFTFAKPLFNLVRQYSGCNVSFRL